MGLSIYAYSNLEKAIRQAPDEGHKVLIIIDNQWKDFAKDLENDTFYSFQDCIKRDIGPYSFYRVWRNELACLADYTPVNGLDSRQPYLDGARKQNDGHFWHLLKFSDCSNYIDSEISKKIYHDFVEFDQKAKDFGNKYSKLYNFYEVYEYFKQAFQTASQNGAVHFN